MHFWERNRFRHLIQKLRYLLVISTLRRKTKSANNLSNPFEIDLRPVNSNVNFGLNSRMVAVA